jgi:uncharacterized protein (TIGR01777 family)
MARILLSGASGPIGKALLPALAAEGHTVVRLARNPSKNSDEILWEASQPFPPQTISGFDAIIHLAGETIAGRWTHAKKQRILETRVEGTRHLAQAAAQADSKPKTFICASAIGYYGSRGDEVLQEDSSSGNGFLAEVWRQWEAATRTAADAGIRSVHTRFGLVLSTEGGALPTMLLPFRLGLGGRIGNGRQWWSWVAIEDLVGAILHALQHDTHGAVNVVAPNPVTNAKFTQTLAAVLSRPAIFPMPAFAARLVFGQMGEELLLASQRVQPAKLRADNYQFRFTELKRCLESLLTKTSSP